MSETHSPQKGDIRYNHIKNKRYRWDSKQWQQLCTKPDCMKSPVHDGFCTFHYSEEQARLKIKLPIDDEKSETTKVSRSLTISELFPIPVRINEVTKRREKWDGTKWRRLCAHPDCEKASRNLCTTHRREQKQRKENGGQTKQTITYKVKATPPTAGHIKKVGKRRYMFDGRVYQSLCMIDGCLKRQKLGKLCLKHKKDKACGLLMDDSDEVEEIKKTKTKPKTGDILITKKSRYMWDGKKYIILCRMTECPNRPRCQRLCVPHLAEQEDMALTQKYYKQISELNNESRSIPEVVKNESSNLSIIVKNEPIEEVKKRPLSTSDEESSTDRQDKKQCSTTNIKTEHLHIKIEPL